jgi:5-methylcytosine-specific restriction enzyme A
MLLLKTRAENIPGVVATSKHATSQLPAAEPGDLVLIAITKATLPPGEKSVQFLARLRGLERDVQGESIDIWKNPWRYLILLEDLREVPPFNIEEVQRSMRSYGQIRTHCRLDPGDEEAVLSWIGEPMKLKVAEPRRDWNS